jgi:hypothetical protein
LPNHFSNNLLNNIGRLTGTKPYIRVGGNSQDYALYNASLPTATFGIVNPAISIDYSTTLFIGPSYFQSYNTWPDTRFTYGFNLRLGGYGSPGWESLLETVPLACKALEHNKLLWWEYGNEPNLYSFSAQGLVRPRTWDRTTYIAHWLNGTRAVKQQLAKACPELLTDDNYGYIAPSFSNTLDLVPTFHDGLNVDQDVKLISSHK